MIDDELDPLDRDALERCVEIAKRDPDRADQLRWKLADGQTWADVAAFASYCLQGRSLRLKPWEEPPSVASEDDPCERDKPAQRLLRKMLKAGLSRYEPNPIAALKKKRAA